MDTDAANGRGTTAGGVQVRKFRPLQLGGPVIVAVASESGSNSTGVGAKTPITISSIHGISLAWCQSSACVLTTHTLLGFVHPVCNTKEK
jgi:hypothetical protein